MIRVLPILVLALITCVPFQAQNPKVKNPSTQECEQWYDNQNVHTIEGPITMVKQISTTKDMTFGTHLIVNFQGKELEIHLDPSWFLEKKKISLRKDDIVRVSGSMGTYENKKSMIAKLLLKKGDTTYPSDDDGFPKWSEKGKNKKGVRNRCYKS